MAKMPKTIKYKVNSNELAKKLNVIKVQIKTLVKNIKELNGKEVEFIKIEEGE
jgi:hypothetical protein